MTSAGMTQMYSWFPVNWQNYFSLDLALSLASQPATWPGPENMLEEQMYNLPLAYTLIEDFTAYKCIEHGIWGRGSRIHVTGAKLAEN